MGNNRLFSLLLILAIAYQANLVYCRIYQTIDAIIVEGNTEFPFTPIDLSRLTTMHI